MKEPQEIHDFIWGRLLGLTEEFANDEVGSPAQLVYIMVEFASMLAMDAAPDSKAAHDLMAKAIAAGREDHDRKPLRDYIVEDNKPQDSDIVLAIHPETSDETLAKAKKHLASIYPDSAFVMSDNVTLGDDYLKRGVHAMTPIVDGECGVMDFDEHGNLVEEDNTHE